MANLFHTKHTRLHKCITFGLQKNAHVTLQDVQSLFVFLEAVLKSFGDACSGSGGYNLDSGNTSTSNEHHKELQSILSGGTGFNIVPNETDQIPELSFQTTCGTAAAHSQTKPNTNVKKMSEAATEHTNFSILTKYISHAVKQGLVQSIHAQYTDTATHASAAATARATNLPGNSSSVTTDTSGNKITTTTTNTKVGPLTKATVSVTVTNPRGEIISQSTETNIVADVDSAQTNHGNEQKEQGNEDKSNLLAALVPHTAHGPTYLTFAQAEHDISVLLRPLIVTVLSSMSDDQKKNVVRSLTTLAHRYNDEGQSAKFSTNASNAFLPSLYSYLPFCWGAALNTDTNRRTNVNFENSMEFIGKEAFLDLSQVRFLFYGLYACYFDAPVVYIACFENSLALLCNWD